MGNVFESVKENVTARQVAEFYGLKVNRNGMACCPFHNDKSPSLKIDRRFYCFGCGEKGDAVDCVSKLFGLNALDSAKKICSDFGLTDIYAQEHERASPKPMKPKKTDEQIFRETEQHTYRVLSDYYHQLQEWKTEYRPNSMDENLHPYFVEALHEIDQTAYQLDTLLDGDIHERAFLISNSGRKVASIEKRLQELKQRRDEEGTRSIKDFRKKSVRCR